jgi:hypothetical protein
MTDRSVSVEIPEVTGVLSASDVLASAQTIAEVQRPDGMIPWFEGGHCDPWNHVEAAMALSVCGLDAEAEAALDWVAESQLADGSWFNYYLRQGVKDARLDTNVCAYVATGVFHRFQVTGELDHLSRYWSTVEAAIDFVLRWQRSDGSILWSVDASGHPETYALLTGSSSIYHALRCAVAIAERLGKERPDWELAAGRLGHAVAHHARSFAPKNEYAMDWYYPVLAGALPDQAAHHRIVSAWDRFVIEGFGVRCVSSQEWVTAAETAECVIALDALGLDQAAHKLFVAAQGLRLADGSYWTGMVYPEEITFPAAERTTYTAAAIVLAADALSGATAASGLFRGEGLPAPLDLPESSCSWGTGDCSARRRQL